jgi:hypothetical protein
MPASIALYKKFHKTIGGQLYDKMYRSIYKVVRYAKEPRQGHKPRQHLSIQMKFQNKIGHTFPQISLDHYLSQKDTIPSMLLSTEKQSRHTS